MKITRLNLDRKLDNFIFTLYSVIASDVHIGHNNVTVHVCNLDV